MEVHQQYWQAIRDKVCVQCVHGDGKGNCNLSSPQWCPLKEFFPEIVMVALNAKTDENERLTNILQRHVCILCDFQ